MFLLLLYYYILVCYYFAILGFILTFFAKELPMRITLETEFGIVDESEKKDNSEEEKQNTFN